MRKNSQLLCRLHLSNLYILAFRFTSLCVDNFFIHNLQCFLLQLICLVSFLIGFKSKSIDFFLDIMISEERNWNFAYVRIVYFINNRSFSEDMMSILYSAYALIYLTRQLQGPLIEIQAPGKAGNTAPAPDDGMQAMTDAGPDSNTVFLHFASHYQLTSREQDILRILLTDKNNQEISDALFISIGTVKTHVHNIFQKVNVTKRSQLLKVYFEYSKDMPWK